MLTIVPLTPENRADYNRPDARHLVDERIQLRFTRNGFLPDYLPMLPGNWHTVKPCAIEAETLLSLPEYGCYLAVTEGRCAGQCVVKRGPHHLCEVVDLRTDSRYRRQGIGTALLNAAMDWAAQQGLRGIRVETTDACPGMCRFLEHSRFMLGGVDMLRRAADTPETLHVPQRRESTLIFYQFIE